MSRVVGLAVALCGVTVGQLWWGVRGEHAATNIRTQDTESSSLAPFLRDEHERQEWIEFQLDNLLDDEQGRRHLNAFADFNRLFQNARIQLPNAYPRPKVGLWTVVLDMWNIECFDLSLDNIRSWHFFLDPQSYRFHVWVDNIDLKCRMDYHYDYGPFHGTGVAKAETLDNQAYSALRFTSPNFDQHGPTGSRQDLCEATIDITSLKLEGDFLSDFVELFKSFFIGSLEEALADLACDELADLASGTVTSVLDFARDTLDPFLQPLAPQESDPLYAEHTSDLDKSRLLDFGDRTDLIGSWFDTFLNEANAMFGGADESGEPGINAFLRDYLLEADGSLIVDLEKTGFPTTVYQGHDLLTETTITLDAVKVHGLDSFSVFAPLVAIGDHTLQNDLHWDFLTIEFDVTVFMKPSTRPDSILVDPTSQGLTEEIKIEFGIDNIEVLASLFLAIDQLRLGDLEIGPLLTTSHILPCVLSVLRDVQISGLEASIGGVRRPVMTGFVTQGIDVILNQAADAAFEMFETVLLRAVPAFFQTTARRIINENVIGSYLGNDANVDCPFELPIPTEFVDLRDFLVEPEFAQIYGGTGDAPYGDLGYTVMGLIEDQLLSVEDEATNSLSINSVLLRPLTESQSGTPGTFQFAGDLVRLIEDDIEKDLALSFMKRFEIALANLRIHNVDMVRAPTYILEATQDPYVVKNILNIERMGPKKLNATVGLFMEIEGRKWNSPLAMRHEMDLSVSLSRVEFAADILAKISTERLFRFQLRNILNHHCWLATIPGPQLDEGGHRLPGQGDSHHAELHNIALILINMLFGFDIDFSSSAGVSILRDLVLEMQRQGAITHLKHRIVSFVETFLGGDWVTTLVDRSLANAPRHCPHLPEYDPDALPAPYENDSSFPGIDRETMDTILYSLAMGAEVALVVFAEEHRLDPGPPTDSLSMQRLVNDPYGSFLDWQNLDGYLSGMVELLLDEMKGYLGGNRTIESTGEKILGINQVIRDTLLKGDERAQWDFKDLDFTIPGVEIGLRGLSLAGLDSFSLFDVWNPIAPQTVTNHFVLESADLNLILTWKNLTSMVENEFVVNFSLKDIHLDVALYISVLKESFSNLQLGSLLRSKDIFGCLLSSLQGVVITEINATIGEIPYPTASGLLFDSNAIVEQYTSTIFDSYKQELLDSVPGIFQSTVRQLVNGFFSTFIRNAACEPLVVAEDGDIIDFTKFFDGNKQIYGDLPPLLKDLVDSELLAVDIEGNARINDFMVDPLTQRQSGEAGTLMFQSTFLEANARMKEIGVENLQVMAKDPKVLNLNTLQPPLRLLDPLQSFLLHNEAGLGTLLKPFQFSLRALFAMSGDPALEMHNELDVAVEIPYTTIAATILARVSKDGFLGFPLKSISSPGCILAILEQPTDPEQSSGLGVNSLDLGMESIHFDFSCVACSSSGMDLLPELLETLERIGVSEMIEHRVIGVAIDLVQSNFFQDFLDVLVSDGKYQCPAHPDFISESFSSQYEKIAFPDLSIDSLETIAFAASVGLQMAAVIVADSHKEYSVTETDPLSAEIDLMPAGSQRLMNFTDLDAIVADWADVGLDQLVNYLGTPEEESGSLPVNRLLKNLLLEEDGSLFFAFDEIGLGSDELIVSLKRIVVRGIDTFSVFDALDFIGAMTAKNHFVLENLSVEVVVALIGDAGTAIEDVEELTLSLSLSKIDIDLSFFLAIDLDILGSIELGSLMKMKNILPCFLSSALAANMTELHVEVDSIDQLGVTGFRSVEVQQAVARAEEQLLDEYGSLLLASIPKIFDSTVRVMLNNWAKYYMDDEENTACPAAMMLWSPGGLVDFRDLFSSPTRRLIETGLERYGDLFQSVYRLVQELVLEVDPQTGLSKANEVLVGPLTRGQSNETGTFAFREALLNYSTRLAVGGFDAEVQLQATNVRISNLDAIGAPMALLQVEPGEPYHLNNTASFGVKENPLHFSLNFLLSLVADGNDELRNEVNIGISLYDATILLRALLQVLEDRLFSFPIRDILDIHCWLAAIPAPAIDARGVRLNGEPRTAGIVQLLTTVPRLKLDISCVSCTSPEMDEFSRLLASPEAQESVTEVANTLLDYGTDLMSGTFVQLFIDRIVNEARFKCPHSPQYDESFASFQYDDFSSEQRGANVSFLVAVGIAFLIVAASTLVLVFSVKMIVRRRHRRWVNRLPQDQVKRLLRQQGRLQEVEAELNAATTSMVASTDIPKWLRYAMPVIIIGNIGFFLSGHLSLGATVNIKAEIAGQVVSVENFFEFSMARSTVDIWNAGGRELAILILIFSGIWPYSKQLITLALWFLPPSWVSISTRGSVLLWLDWLAKWSMVDIFVLIISLAAFRISVKSPDVGFLPDGFYSVDLLVVPLWGLYANMIAQLISQVSSHFIIHYHRQIVHQATVEYKQKHNLILNDDICAESMCEGSEQRSMPPSDEGSAEAVLADNAQKTVLAKYRYKRPHRGEDEPLIVRRYVNGGLCFLASLLCALVIAGCVLPSFSLEILGLIGIVVESGQDFKEASTKHNLFSVINLLIDQARFLNTAGDLVGLGVLSTLLLFSVLLVPIFQGATLLWQWFWPATERTRRRMLIAIETMQAWQYAEVWIIAVFVSAWQLGPVSEFMINTYCASLQPALDQMVYFGLIKDEDAQCFSVYSEIGSGAFVLAGGAAVLALLNTFVVKASIQFLRDRDESEMHIMEGFQSSRDLASKGVDEEATAAVGDSFDESDEFTALPRPVEEIEERPTEIRPVPVLFSDTFRWLLVNAERVGYQDGEAQQAAMAGRLEAARSNYMCGDLDRVDEKVLHELSGASSVSGRSSMTAPDTPRTAYSGDDRDILCDIGDEGTGNWENGTTFNDISTRGSTLPPPSLDDDQSLYDEVTIHTNDFTTMMEDDEYSEEEVTVIDDEEN